MTTQEYIDERAQEVMQAPLAAQTAHTLSVKQAECRQARFMFIANLILAILCAAYAMSRFAKGRVDVPTLFVLAAVAIGVGTTRKRLISAKAALSSLRSASVRSS